jgi:ketosteroid isomerase-like protein
MSSANGQTRDRVEPAKGSAEAQIREGEREWTAAIASGDVSGVRRILADDFVGIGSDALPYNKADAISWIESGHGDFVYCRLDAPSKIRFFGDTAVAQGSESWERRTGEPRKGRFVWTEVWVRRNGRWQVVASQDEIAAPLPVK